MDLDDEDIRGRAQPTELEQKFKRNQKPSEVVRYVVFIAVFYAVINMQLEVTN